MKSFTIGFFTLLSVSVFAQCKVDSSHVIFQVMIGDLWYVPNSTITKDAFYNKFLTAYKVNNDTILVKDYWWEVTLSNRDFAGHYSYTNLRSNQQRMPFASLTQNDTLCISRLIIEKPYQYKGPLLPYFTLIIK